MKYSKLFLSCITMMIVILLVLSSNVYASSSSVSSSSLSTSILSSTNTLSDMASDLPELSNSVIDDSIITSDIAPSVNNEEINPNSTVFACNSYKNIDTNVDGDVFVCANTVEINSTIEGNVFLCAGTVTIAQNANIKGSLFICAEYVNVNGGNFANIYNFSKSFVLEKDANVEKDIFLAVEHATINGTIARDAFIGCKLLDANVSTAKIGNNLNYSAESSVPNIDKIVTGNVNFDNTSERNETIKATADAFKPVTLIMHIVTSLVCAILIALIILFFCDNFANKSEKLIMNKPFITFLYGFVGILAVIAISIVAMISIIGITFGLLLGLLVTFTLLISSTITTVTLSKLIADHFKNGKGITILFVMLFTIVYALIGYIPILGGIVKYIYFVYGFGIIIYCFTHKVIPEKNTSTK